MKLHDEAEIFEDINRFIQLFKKGLTFLELIIQNAKKKDELRVYIEKQKNSLVELLQLAQKYSQQTDHLNVDQNTYLRFCNRLIETISLMKTQQLNANNLEFMHYLTEMLKKLKKTVKTNQQQRKFKQLISDTYWLFLNVCSKLEAHLFKEQNLCASKSCQKLKEKGQQVMINRKILPLKRDENSLFYKLKNDSLEKIIRNQPRPQMSRINKTIGNVNARYDTLKCLDINYQYFKNSTFEAMQRSVPFQKQYLCRNQEAVRLVKLYMDDFFLFQKKRELKINRKNKRANLETEYDCHGSMNSVLQEVRQRKSHLKLIKNKMNQTMNQRSNLDKWSRGKDEQLEKNNQLKKIFTNQSNKTLYNPINHFLIFGKRQTKHTDKMGRKDEKKSQKKVLQTHSINLSIFRQDPYQNTHWQSQKPIAQHKSVKKQLENPVLLRFQQQLQQMPKEDSSRQDKESSISSPIKKVIKSRDGQLNLAKMPTEPSQPQNFLFKDRVVKYRTKIEPKLRNIIFNSKQL